MQADRLSLNFKSCLMNQQIQYEKGISNITEFLCWNLYFSLAMHNTSKGYKYTTVVPGNA